MAEKGLVVLFTGKGKGKTTAALGTAVRALGHGMRVCVVQFIKSSTRTGESRFFTSVEGIDLHVAGLGFVSGMEGGGSGGRKDIEEHRRAAREAWDLAKSCLSSPAGLVILDEITYPVHWGMIDSAEVIDALDQRPPGMHVVLTGRDADPALLEQADLVTEMREIKHPMHEGVRAQKGIEF